MAMTRRRFLATTGALGVAGCARTKELIGKGDDDAFSIATVGDTHVVDLRSTSIVQRAVAQINADGRVALTVAVGDMATDGKLQELTLTKRAFDRLESAFHAIPGNHDVDMTSQDIYGNYRKVFGEADWRANHGHWTFIGLDSCEGAASDVSIRPDRLEWLQKQLDRVKPGRPIGLFTHHPFNPNTQAYRVLNADETLALFADHNLKFVASGHFHGNQVEERDGVLFATTACCSSTRGNHDGTEARGFRLFHIDGEAIETEFVEVPL